MNIATPALGPSFGVAPAGTSMWMSVFSKRGTSIPSSGAILDDAERGLRAFLHHVAELAGEDQSAAAWSRRSPR